VIRSSLQIAFGKRRVPGGEAVALRSGHAVISEGAPAICLNSSGWLTPPPDLIMAMQDRRLLRELCRDGLAALTLGFSAAAQRATHRYLEALEAQFPAPLEPPFDLFHPSDRFFAALLPMPAPRIALAGGDGRLSQSDVAEADLAFWDGQGLVLISFGDGAQYTPRQRKAREGLVALAPVPVRFHMAPVHRDTGVCDLFPADILSVADRASLPVYGPVRLAPFQEQLAPA